MTKVRPPMSFHRALHKIAAEIGWDVCADAVEKSETMLRKMSDPDAQRELTLRDAVRLDRAFRNAGGEGFPLHECYALKLEMAPAAELTETRLLDLAQDATKESGEAVTAVLAVIQNLDCVRRRGAALTELEEAIAALTAIAANLKGG